MVDQFSAYEGIPASYTTPPMHLQPEKENTVSLIRELSPQGVLNEMMQQIQGKIYDDVQSRYVKIEGAKPLMNEEGIDTFFHFATAMISALVTMSNYTKDYKTIHAMVRYHVKKANIHFHLHYKDYGISRKTKINIITSKLFILGLSAFYKAIGAGDRKAATSNISESISTLARSGFERPQEDKKGIVRRILGR